MGQRRTNVAVATGLLTGKDSAARLLMGASSMAAQKFILLAGMSKRTAQLTETGISSRSATTTIESGDKAWTSGMGQTLSPQTLARPAKSGRKHWRPAKTYLRQTLLVSLLHRPSILGNRDGSCLGHLGPSSTMCRQVRPARYSSRSETSSPGRSELRFS